MAQPAHADLFAFEAQGEAHRNSDFSRTEIATESSKNELDIVLELCSNSPKFRRFLRYEEKDKLA